MLDIAFAKPALPKGGALVLLLGEGETGGMREALDHATDGALDRALAGAQFTGAKGKTCLILAPGGGYSRILVVGLGPAEGRTLTVYEEAGGHAVASLGGRETSATILAASTLTPAQAAGVGLGAVLRAYRFDSYRTREKPEDRPALAKLTLAVTDEVPAARAAWATQKAVAEGIFVTRNLVSEPPNVLYPAEMAERCRALTSLGLKVEVMGQKELEKLGFGALLGVAQGSAREPQMVVLQWHGASGAGGGKGGKSGGKSRPKAAGPVAFVGKGVTFDTGGISIKPAAGMEDMKWDMAGAGTVVGLMAALAGRKAPVDAVGLIGLVENMPSGTAMRPGDVVKSASGQTIEVLNTDAEGRLVLADVIHYAQERFKPRFIVDLATLTGAIIISLGHEHAGLFSNDDTLSERLLAAGEGVGEAVWRMPLGEAYDKQLKSEIADMKNIGGRPGGSITAAQFIKRFVQDGIAWAHLDIAGTAWSTKDTAMVPKGATAFGVRLLNRLVEEHYEGAGEG